MCSVPAMDERQVQVSDTEQRVQREETWRRRRKKAISSASSASMEHVTVEFVLPTVARSGGGPDRLLLDVAGNWTVDQVRRSADVQPAALVGCETC